MENPINISISYFIFQVFRSAVLCCVRAAGPVCPGKCRGGRPHEAPGGDSQAGEGSGGGES